MSPHRILETDVAAIRQAFDVTFAVAATPPPDARTSFLALRIGGAPYAVPAGAIAAVIPLKAIVPLPGQALPFLGLAGHQGHVLPVYSLDALILPAEPPPPRWLLVCRHRCQLALAFADLDGFQQVAADAIQPPGDSQGATTVGRCLTPTGETRPILDLSALITTIQHSNQKE